MSAYTPGPWRWCGFYLLQDAPKLHPRPGEENERETNPYATPCGRPIASDGSAGGEYHPDIDIDGPDARLIAAAPELLEALKSYTPFIYASLHPAALEVYKQANAAIAKACPVENSQPEQAEKPGEAKI